MARGSEVINFFIKDTTTENVNHSSGGVYWSSCSSCIYESNPNLLTVTVNPFGSMHLCSCILL